MRILNLYAGIGGNRRSFGEDNYVTAVEIDPKIASIYQDNFPKDTVIVGDAHEYLLKHFREYDFIWTSPPCPSHSRIRKQCSYKKDKEGNVYEQNKPIYADMRLYQEIILLQNYFEGIYVVENVIPYYKPLIEPYKLGRHCFWSNIEIPYKKFEKRGSFDNIKELSKKLNFDLEQYKGINKKLLLRNCVEKELSDYIFEKVKEEMSK